MIKKLKLTYWLLGFGCGIVLSGTMGILYSLNIQEYRSDVNSGKSVAVTPENSQNPIKTSEINEPEQYKTEKYEKQEHIIKQESPEQESPNRDNSSSNKILSESLEVFIPSQSRATDIAKILEVAGVLENSNAFIQFIEDQNKTTKLRHGSLIFRKNLNYEEILDILIQD